MASKYHNQKTLVQGIQFDSRKEANRYQELLHLERVGQIRNIELQPRYDLERVGQIRNIELQPRYDLVVNGHKLGFYKGDFRYEEVTTGAMVTEDVKGVRTAVYQLKKKLVKALYSIEIVEV